jgi:hypothetical protein
MRNFLIVIFVAIAAFQLSAQDDPFNQQGINNPNRFYADLVAKTATLKGVW